MNLLISARRKSSLAGWHRNSSPAYYFLVHPEEGMSWVSIRNLLLHYGRAPVVPLQSTRHHHHVMNGVGESLNLLFTIKCLRQAVLVPLLSAAHHKKSTASPFFGFHTPIHPLPPHYDIKGRVGRYLCVKFIKRRVYVTLTFSHFFRCFHYIRELNKNGILS